MIGPHQRSTVLITGVGGPAGRASASYFEAKGYRVIGTDMRRVESPASVFRLVPAAGDPGFPQALLEIAVDEGADLVLPTVTEELPVVARMRPALRERRIALCVSDPPGVDIANDKLRTVRELRNRGVAVPTTFPGTTPGAEVVGALGYPLLSKPRFGRGGRGVAIHWTEDDLIGAGTDGIVWQAFLPGEEFDVNVFVDRGDRPATTVVLRKTALKEGLVGNALSVDRVSRPDVAALGLCAARVLGLEGPVDIDIRLGNDGAPAVLDVNARVGANVLSAREVMDALDDAWRSGRCA